MSKFLLLPHNTVLGTNIYFYGINLTNILAYNRINDHNNLSIILNMFETMDRAYDLIWAPPTGLKLQFLSAISPWSYHIHKMMRRNDQLGTRQIVVACGRPKLTSNSVMIKHHMWYQFFNSQVIFKAFFSAERVI